MRLAVFGYYGKQNIGDELFREAFRALFPDHSFSFFDRITRDNASQADAIIIGGGSLLNGDFPHEPEALPPLAQKPLLYISVGAETAIHPFHERLLRQARLVAIRSPSALEKMLALNEKTIVIHDLVYSLGTSAAIKRLDKSLLFLPNIYTLPRHSDPHWMHTAWGHFKNEIAQAFDDLVDDGWMLRMMPMSSDRLVNDALPAYEIIGAMRNRGDYLIPGQGDIKSLKTIFKEFEVVISQRYHGLVLAEMTMTKLVSIAHSHKLQETAFNQGEKLSYYGFSKDLLHEARKNSSKQSFKCISPHMFEELQTKVECAMHSLTKPA